MTTASDQGKKPSGRAKVKPQASSREGGKGPSPDTYREDLPKKKKQKKKKDKKKQVRRSVGRLPDVQEVVVFLGKGGADNPRRELLRAFHISAKDRAAFKKVLQEARDIIAKGAPGQGGLESHAALGRSAKEGLPKVLRAVVKTVSNNQILAQPQDTAYGPHTFVVQLPENPTGKAQIQRDDLLLLLRQKQLGKDRHKGVLLKVLTRQAPKTVMGVLHRKGKTLFFQTLDRREQRLLRIISNETRAQAGDLVEASLLQARGRQRGGGAVTVVKKLGDMKDPKLISLVSLLQADLPYEFSAQALEQADSASLPGLEGREDLRGLPLVTIDGIDAKDFDDAVWAESTKTGFHIVVAIADVAYYVPIGSVLDKEAYARGNSVYFPDRVVPMLPEALSNGMCSLKPQEDRACLAVHLWISNSGELEKYRFVRGLMRSSARLTYNQVQSVYHEPATDTALWQTVEPLFMAYKALALARKQRGTLELDLPERQIFFNKFGDVESILPRTRFDSHKLVEEMMILANVAAAMALKEKNMPGLYRVHEKPDVSKVDVLLAVLRTMGIQTGQKYAKSPDFFNQVLAQVEDHPARLLVQEMVLRSQSQAVYQPENVGHFGLSLQDYAHFTSPIRRYADLIVHRSLISCLHLGPGGWPAKPEVDHLEQIGTHISATERQAMKAERSAMSRYIISFMESKVGAQFVGRVSGVSPAGLFVELIDTGAEGFLPKSYLPRDVYQASEKSPALVGRRHTFTLGDPIYVQIEEANALTNGMLFSYVSGRPL